MNHKPGVERRKILIIDPSFQKLFIVKFFGMVAAGSVMMGSLVYLFCGRTVTTVFRNSRLEIVTTMDFILPGLLMSSAAVIAVVGTATALIALYLSHRIAGPVYRMRCDLESFKAGNLKQIFSLRSKDELKALSKGLNEMARSVQASMKTLKEEAEHLEKISAELSPKGKEHLKALKKVLDSYHA